MATSKKTIERDDLGKYLVNTFFKEWSDDRQLTGLELEVIPFKRSETGDPFIVPLQTTGRAYSLWQDKDIYHPWPGLVHFLRQNHGAFQGLKYEPLDEFTPRFVLNSGAQITFEPGGQLEYSSTAMESIEEVTRGLFQTLNSLEELLKPFDISFFYGALNPWFKTEEVGLQIRKARYLSMDRYFTNISPYGQKMMRLTASFQVNLDVGDQETAQRRWLASNLLSPIFMAMFANSPFHERKFTGAKSFRGVIWSKLDPSRTGFQPGFLDDSYCPCPAKQYLDFALKAHCMLPDRLGLLNQPIRFETWMEEGFEGQFPDMEDWETHLSTLFPEVRPRGFLEMRYMDTLPKAFYSVPGTLLRRFLYDDELREHIIQEMEPHRSNLPELLNEAAYKGLESPTLFEKARGFYQELLKRPADGDENLLAIAEAFFSQYTAIGRNPADDILDLNGGNCPSFDQFRALAEKRLNLVSDPLDRLLSTGRVL